MNKIQLPVQQPKYGWEPNVTVDAAIHTSQNLIVKVLSRFLPLNHQFNGSGVILSLPQQFIGSTGMVHFTRKNMQTTFASYPSTFHQHCQKQKGCPFQPNGRFSYPYYIENRVGTQHRNSIFYSRHQKHCEAKKQTTAMPDRRRTRRHLFGWRSYVRLPFDRSRLRLQRL